MTTHIQSQNAHGWFKFVSVLVIIMGSLTAIAGLPMLLFFGAGILYIALGAVMIFIGLKVWNSGELLESMNDGNQDVVSRQITNNFIAIVKTYGILIAVALALTLLMFVAMAVFGFSALNSSKDSFLHSMSISSTPAASSSSSASSSSISYPTQQQY